MTDPCRQNERLITLEMILERVSDTMAEQKEIGRHTLEKLSVLAVQSEQIKSLTQRTDKTEKDIEWQYDRIRKTEEAIATHSAFITQHHERDEKASKVTAPVIAGLIVAAIVAACIFAISMVDRHNYTAQPEDRPSFVIPPKPAIKRSEQ